MSLLDTKLKFGDVLKIIDRSAALARDEAHRAIGKGDERRACELAEVRCELADIKSQITSLAYDENIAELKAGN